METLGLCKTLHFMGNKLSIVEIATDASISIKAMLGVTFSSMRFGFHYKFTITARDYPHIFHSLDVCGTSQRS